MPINLDKVHLEADVRNMFSDLGFTTIDAAIGAARAVPHLARRIGIDSTDIASRFGDTFALQSAATPRFSLGARLLDVPASRHAFELLPTTIVLPAATDLVSEMPPIRDQKRRGTCVAFATLAVLEHRLSRGGISEDLSEQFQYWNCKRHDGDPSNSGTYVAVSFPLLVSDGCCREATWAYFPDDIPGNEGQNPPPAGAVSEAAAFRQTGVKSLPPTSVRAIKSELAKGNCVAFSIPVFESWYGNDAVILSGDIVMPFSQELPVGGHAMCIVGYTDSQDVGNPGGGRFLIRNSWGDGWGKQNPRGAGYGTIPYSYVDQYGVEAYTLS